MKDKNIAVLAQKKATKQPKNKNKKILKKIDKVVSRIEKQVTKLLQVSQTLQKLRLKVIEEQKAA